MMLGLAGAGAIAAASALALRARRNGVAAGANDYGVRFGLDGDEEMATPTAPPPSGATQSAETLSAMR